MWKMGRMLPICSRFKSIPLPIIPALRGPQPVRPAFRSGKRTRLENRVTVGTNKKRPAIVFLVAGQSNAGGCGVISPEAHEARGCHIERPLVPGSTAKEVGLSTNPDDYTHSYIWVPDHGFRVDSELGRWDDGVIKGCGQTQKFINIIY